MSFYNNRNMYVSIKMTLIFKKNVDISSPITGSYHFYLVLFSLILGEPHKMRKCPEIRTSVQLIAPLPAPLWMKTVPQLTYFVKFRVQKEHFKVKSILDSSWNDLEPRCSSLHPLPASPVGKNSPRIHLFREIWSS